MFSHVVVGSNDLHASKIFYDAIFEIIGAKNASSDTERRLIYKKGTTSFLVMNPVDGHAATAANGGTIGFSLPSSDAVQQWYNAGVKHGGTSIEDPPGERRRMGKLRFVAYLRDPDGNKLCAFYPIES